MRNGERVPRLQCSYLTSVVGEKMTNSLPPDWRHTRHWLLLSELGLLSSVALPTGSLSSQANRVRWSLEGHSNARNIVTNTIACSPLPRVRLPIQNLTLKFRPLKFSFSYLEASYEKLYHTKFVPYKNFLLCSMSLNTCIACGTHSVVSSARMMMRMLGRNMSVPLGEHITTTRSLISHCGRDQRDVSRSECSHLTHFEESHFLRSSVIPQAEARLNPYQQSESKGQQLLSCLLVETHPLFY